MDIIYLRDLRIDTIIGVYDWERHVKQTTARPPLMTPSKTPSTTVKWPTG